MGVYNFQSTATFSVETDFFFGIDEFIFASQMEDLDIGAKAKSVDGSGWGTDWSKKRPVVRDGEWKAKGHYCGDKGNISWLLNWRFGLKTPRHAWASLAGLSVGAPIHAMPCYIDDAGAKASMNDSGKFEGGLLAAGACDMGYVMVSPYTTNVLTTTGTSTPDDTSIYLPNGSNGGACYVFVNAIVGGTAPTIVPKVSHSTDGVASYVDLTPVSPWGTILGADSTTWVQYVEIPSTQTINPFVKIGWTTTGAPTQVQALAIFARRPDRSK